MKNPKNLILRKNSSMWYIQARVNGRRISESTGTADVSEAIGIRDMVLAQARAGRWDLLQEAKRQHKASAVTVGAIIAKYRAEAFIRGIRPITCGNNVRSLRLMIRRSGCRQEPDNLPVSALNRQLVTDYLREALVPDTARRRRTARSTLLQAKSLFTPWAMEAYGDMIKKDDVREFLAAGMFRVKQIVYGPVDPFLVRKTIARGRALREKDPDLYAAFVLCYDLALRAGEARSAQYSWLRTTDDGQTVIDIKTRHDFVPKSGDRSIPLDDQTAKELMAMRRDSDPYILPGLTVTGRRRLINYRLADWMRSLGWVREDFVKAAHELRKLRGSQWYTEIDPQTAREWLGHVDISTTCRFYARLSRQPKQLPRKDLIVLPNESNPEPAAKAVGS